MKSITTLVAALRGRAKAAATVTLLILAAAVLNPAVTAGDQPDGSRWVGTWSASPEAANAPIHFNAQTIRQIVHTSWVAMASACACPTHLEQSPW